MADKKINPSTQMKRSRKKRKEIEKKLAEVEKDREFLAERDPEHFGSIFEIKDLPDRY